MPYFVDRWRDQWHYWRYGPAGVADNEIPYGYDGYGHEHPEMHSRRYANADEEQDQHHEVVDPNMPRRRQRRRANDHGRFAQPVLGTLVTVGFFFVMWYLFHEPDNGTNGMREARLIMLGALQAAFGMVIAYYFGSSKGSTEKDQLLFNSQPMPFQQPRSITTTVQPGATGATTTTTTVAEQPDESGTAEGAAPPMPEPPR